MRGGQPHSPTLADATPIFRSKLRKWRVLPVGILGLALVASSVLTVEPAGASGVTPQVAVPAQVRAVATQKGTEVSITPADAGTTYSNSLQPTGYEVVSCGAYALTSVQLNTALLDYCEKDSSKTTTILPANKFTTTVSCQPSVSTWCVVAVTALSGLHRSGTVRAGSGGVAPQQPTNLVAIPLQDGKSIGLTWTPGPDSVQESKMPALSVSFEVFRNGILIASDLTTPEFTDSGCGVDRRCHYEVKAVSAAGRTQPATGTMTTLGLTAPSLSPLPSGLLAPGSSVISGFLGGGPDDERPVLVSLAPLEGSPGVAQTVLAVVSAGTWRATIPSTVVPGVYSISASQGGHTSTSTTAKIASIVPLTASVGAASNGQIPVAHDPLVTLSGTATSSPPAPQVQIQDSWGYSAAEVSALSQSELSVRFATTPSRQKGQPSFVSVDAGGAWASQLDLTGSQQGIHLIAISQSPPGRQPTTRFLLVDFELTQSLLRRAASVPSKPAAPTVATVGDGQVVLTWTTPSANGSPITSYVVEVANDSSKACTYTVGSPGAANRCTVMNLTNGTNYNFTVRALNVNGSSLASLPSPAAKPYGRPAAPSMPRVVAGNVTATVTWTAPSSNGSPLTSYVVTSTPDNKSCTYVVPATGIPANSCSVTGLMNGRSYTFSVVAKNLGGTSDPSAASTAVVPAAPPVAPAKPTVSAAGSGQVRVNWSTPSSPFAPILSYQVTATPGGRTCTYTVPFQETPADACVVTGLTNGTSYTFTVVATNSIGTSGSSPASLAVTPVTVPGAPSAVNGVGGLGNVTVTWSPSTTTGGSKILFYTVSVAWSSSTASCTYPVPATGTPTYTCTVPGLTNGYFYTFSVTATNAAGASTAAYSRSLVAGTAPGMPTGVRTFSDDGQVTLAWTPPSVTGGMSVSYKAEVVGDATKYCWASSGPSCTISGLANGTSYNFIVTASNNAGSSSPTAKVAGTPVGPAGSPTNVSSIVAGNSVIVTWGPPGTTGGAAVTGYQVTARPEVGSSLIGTFSSTARIGIITGLRKDVRYVVSVQAINSHGAGRTSDPITAITTALANPPTGVSALAGSTSATVSWTAPVQPTLPVTSYTVRATDLTDANGSLSLTVPATPNPSAVVTGLQSSQSYSFSVTANNGAGASAPSTASPAVWVGPPAPPALASTSGGDFKADTRGEMSVSWMVPASIPGVTITGYTVTATPTSGDPVTVTAAADATGITLTGLSPWVPYAFSVSANSIFGAGPSVSAGVAIPPGPPDKPVILSTAVDGTKFTITFAPQYKTTYGNNGDSSESGTFRVSDTAGYNCAILWLGQSSCDFYLALDTPHTFAITATNDWGSTSSDPTSVTIPSPPLAGPFAPTRLQVATGVASGTATIGFSEFWGGPGYDVKPETYTASVVGDPSKSCSVPYSDVSLQLSCDISGLTDGASYQFVVTVTSGTRSVTSNPSQASLLPYFPPAPLITNVVVDGTAISVFFHQDWYTSSSNEYVASHLLQLGSLVLACPGSVSVCSYSGLDPATAYPVSLWSVDEANRSTQSDVWGTITPNSLPGIPQSLSVTPGDESVDVSYTGPAVTSGVTVTGYQVNLTDRYDPSAARSVVCPGDLNGGHCHISGLANGEHLSFTVASLDGGVASLTTDPVEAIPYGAPSIPVNVRVSAGDQSATISFGPSDGNGRPVLGYKVFTTDLTTSITTTTYVTSTSTSIGSLVNGDRYSFSVSAFSSDKESGASPASSSVTPAGVPMQPTDVVTTPGDGSLSVTLTENDNGSAVTGYTVVATDLRTNFQTTFTSASLPLQLTGLPNFDTYALSITATNGVGTSWAGYGYGRPTPPPSAPTVSNVSSGDTTASVTFGYTNLPLWGRVGGDDYTVTLTDSQTGTSLSSVVTPTQDSVTPSLWFGVTTFTGLTNGHVYFASVKGRNAAGFGPSSALSDPIVPSGVPDAPTGVSVDNLGSSLQVQWTDSPSTPGSPVSGYLATANPGGLTCVSAGSSCSIAGVTDGTVYSVTVQAVNGRGVSTPSASALSSPLTPIPATTAPSAPTSVRATASNDMLLVQWTAPANTGGGTITGYRATVSPGNTSCTSLTAHSCTISGLDRYAIYTVTVIATNSVGSSVSSAPSPEASTCGIDNSWCSWGGALQPYSVAATEVAGGLQVSWLVGQDGLNRAVAEPSGMTCAPITTSGGVGSCLIPGAPGSFAHTEVVRVEGASNGVWGLLSSRSVHPTWWAFSTVSAPSSSNDPAPQVSGTLSFGSVATLEAAPLSCADPYSCPQAVTWSVPVTNGTWAASLSGLADGMYTLFLAGTDPLGILPIITLDRTPPATTISGPPGTHTPVGEQVAQVMGTAECDSSTTLTLRWFAGTTTSGTPLATVTPIRGATPSCSWSDTQPSYADGTYTAVVEQTDVYGNDTTKSIVVIVDNVGPSVSVTSPPDGSTVGEGVVTFSGTTSTTVGDLPGVILTLRNGSTVLRRILPIVDGTFAGQVTLAAGSWTATYLRSDQAGNSASTTTSLTVIHGDATVGILLPSAGASVAQSTTVTGWARPGATLQLSSGSTNVASVTADTTGFWARTVNLPADATSVTVDDGSQTATTALTVGSPKSEISVVPSSLFGTQSAADLYGTAPASTLLNVTVDGVTNYVGVDASGIWHLDTTGISEGWHLVSAANGWGFSNVNLDFDRTAPTLAFSPPSTDPTNTSSLTLASPSVLGDAATVHLRWFSGTTSSGTPVLESDQGVTGDVTLVAIPSSLPDGLVTAQAIRRDAAGNVASTSLSFTRDTTAPGMTSNLASLMSGPLTVTGTYGTQGTDAVPTASVDGLSVPLTLAVGTYRLSTALMDGIHLVTLSQSDSSGNLTTNSLWVTVDSIAPDLTLEQTDGAVGSTMTLGGSASGNDGPVSLALTPETSGRDVVTAIVTPLNGRWSASPLQDVASTDGWWDITAVRTDAVGNVSRQTIRYLVDPARPSLQLTSPTNPSNSVAVVVAGTTSAESWRSPTVHITISSATSQRVLASADATVVDGAFRWVAPTSSEYAFNVRVTRTDALGSVSATAFTSLDLLSPALTMPTVSTAPVSAICGTAGADQGDASTVSVNFTSLSSSVTATVLRPWETGSPHGHFCASPPSSGQWSFRASQSDNAGNITTTPLQNATFDVVAPTPTMDAPSPAVTDSLTDPPSTTYPIQAPTSLSGTATNASGDAGTVAVTLSKEGCTGQGCTITKSVSVDAARRWTLAATEMTTGIWNVVSVTQSDAAGNLGTFLPPSDAVASYRFKVFPAPSTATLSVSSTGVSMRACPGPADAPYDVTLKAYLGVATGTPLYTIAFPGSDRCASTSTSMVNFNDARNGVTLVNGVYSLVAETSDSYGRRIATTPVSYTANFVRPVVTVAGLTSNVSGTPGDTASLASAPVLRGTGSVNGYDTRTITLLFTQSAGDSGYRRGSWSGLSVSATTQLQDDGTWSWTLPSSFPAGTFSVEVDQGQGQAWGSFTVVAQKPGIDTAAMRSVKNADGSTSQTLVLSGWLPSDRAMTSLSVDLLTPSANAQQLCSSATVSGARWTCSKTGSFPDGVYSFGLSGVEVISYSSCQAYDPNYNCLFTTQQGSQAVSGDSFTSGFLKGSYPAPLISSPTGAGVPISGTVNVAGTSSTSSGNLATITLRAYSGSSATGNAAQTVTVTASGSQGGWTGALAGLADGTWTIQASQSDNAGHVGTSNAVTIVVDSTPPVITTTWPTPGASTPVAGVYGTMTGGVGDATGLVGSLLNGTFTVGTISYYSGTTTSGTPVKTATISTNPAKVNPTPGNSFSDTSSLTAGTWTAKLTATDQSGNTATKTLTFRLAPAAATPLTPVVTAELKDSTGTTLPLNGTITPGAGAAVVHVHLATGLSAGPAPDGTVQLWNGATLISSSTGGSDQYLNVTLGGATSYALKVVYTGNALYRAAATIPANVIPIRRIPTSVSLSATYAEGAASDGLMTVAVNYLSSELSDPVTKYCASGTVTISDASGRILLSAMLGFDAATWQKISAPTTAGLQTVVVNTTAGTDCAAAHFTATLNLQPTPIPAPVAVVGSVPGVVGGDRSIALNASLPSMRDAASLPVWQTDSRGLKISDSKILMTCTYWTRVCTGTLHVSPTQSGINPTTLIFGGADSGYQEQRVALNIPTEPAAIAPSISFSKTTSHPGDDLAYSIHLGGPGLLGALQVADAATPNIKTTVPFTCTADSCDTAPTALPASLVNAGASGRLKATFTSSLTSYDYSTSATLPRTPYQPTLQYFVGAGAPRGLVATGTASGAVTLSWVAPSANDATITGYQVTATPTPSSADYTPDVPNPATVTSPCSGIGTSTTCTVTGLTNGDSYDFTVATVSDVGTSSVATVSAMPAASGASAQTAWASASTTGQVARDEMLPVRAILTYPNGMPTSLRRGAFVLSSRPSTSCLNPYAYADDPASQIYCTGTSSISSTTISGTSSLTSMNSLSVSGVDAASMTQTSLAAAGLTTSSVASTTTASFTGDSLTVTTQLYVGGGSFDLSAAFTPFDTSVVSTVASGDPVSTSQPSPVSIRHLTGIGAPPIHVAVASAVLTGSWYGPQRSPDDGSSGPRVLSWSDWGVRSPQVGETAFVRATVDSVFGTPGDKTTPVSLSEAMPSGNMLYVHPSDPGYINNLVTTATTKSMNNSFSLNSTGLSCSSCAVWWVRNLDSTDAPETGGGLTGGTRALGVVSYVAGSSLLTAGSSAEIAARTGINMFPLVVNPWPTTQSASAAFDASSNTLQVVTQARWLGMAPEVQTSVSDVSVMVSLNHGDQSTPIAYCFYSGLCLDSDGNGTTFDSTTAVTIGPRLNLGISLGRAFTAGDTVTVTTSTPWGVDASTSNIPVSAPSSAVDGSGNTTVKVAGSWLGASLQKPDLSSPWPLVDWAFYNSTKDFFVSIFGDGKTTAFFMQLTGFIIEMTIEYIMTGGPMSPMAELSALKDLGDAISAGVKTSKLARMASKAWNLPTMMKLWVITKMPQFIARRMLTESGLISQGIKKAVFKLGGKYLHFYAIEPAERSALASVGMGTATTSSLESHPGLDLGQAAGPTDPSFTPSTSLATDIAAVAQASTSAGGTAAVDAFNAAVTAAYNKAQASSPPEPTDVGYGTGIAIQFEQFFSSITTVAIANLSSYDTSKSKVTFDLMQSPSTSGSGVVAGTLGNCTLGGVCNMVDGITATPVNGSIVVSGVYPQNISWAPPGAWIRVTVTTVTTSGAAGPTTVSFGDIPFAGTRYNCWADLAKIEKQYGRNSGPWNSKYGVCATIDDAQTGHGVPWFMIGGDETGLLPWPTPFRPEYDYNPDTAKFISPF